MPSQPPRESSGHAGKKVVVKAVDDLTWFQKKVFFNLGATLFVLVLLRFAVQDIIRPHEHASALVVGAEYGGSVAFLVIAIAMMVPPFGMWMIEHVPLPGFLKRKSG